MASSGHGTMTPIPAVSGGTSPATASWEWRTRDASRLSVRLTDYATVVGIPSLLFWGVSRGAVVPERAMFMSGRDRQLIKSALKQASRMIESQLTTRLVPLWETDTAVFTGYNPLQLEHKQFIEAGERAFTVYHHNAPVTYSGELAYVSVAHGGVGDWDEVRVFYCDSQYDEGPEPMAVEFGPTNVRLTFPRERLIKPSVQMTGVYERNPAYQAADWSDISNFCAALTIAREYTNTTSQACFRLRRSCTTVCGWDTQSGCVRVEDADLGWVNVHPATYTGGQWYNSSYRVMPEQVIVYYLAGHNEDITGMEEAVIRLAHTLMPDPACMSGSEPLSNHWERDRNVSTSMTRERQNCPWGAMDGAWFAWNYITNLPWYIGRGGGWLGTPARRMRRWDRVSPLARLW